tara:strand:- start:9961 stop:10065 length:105 start_codon:yes stop_codon:yes gene_type:complete
MGLIITLAVIAGLLIVAGFPIVSLKIQKSREKNK